LTKEISKRYRPIDQNTHKGIQGHALIIAGSYGKIGAAVLASKGCLKLAAAW
jgi:NAD(P)H-hydrate repair Nnr-like enzyme with NAD(P)H-hydrate dehydratase domain